MADKLTTQLNQTDKKVEELSKNVTGNKFKKLINLPDVINTPTTETFGLTDTILTTLIEIGGEGWYDGEFLLDTEAELSQGSSVFQILDIKNILGAEFKEWYVFHISEAEQGALVTLPYKQLGNISTHAYKDLKVMYRNPEKQFEELKRKVRIVGEGRLEIDVLAEYPGFYFVGIYSDTYLYNLGEISITNQKMDTQEDRSAQTYIRYEPAAVPLENRGWINYGTTPYNFDQELSVGTGYLYYKTMDTKLTASQPMSITSVKEDTKCIVAYKNTTVAVDVYEASYFDTPDGYVFPANTLCKYLILADTGVANTGITYTRYPGGTIATITNALTTISTTGNIAIAIRNATPEQMAKIRVIGFTGDLYANTYSGGYDYLTALDTGTKIGKQFLIPGTKSCRAYIISDTQPTLTLNGVAKTSDRVWSNKLGGNIQGKLWTVAVPTTAGVNKLVSNVNVFVILGPESNMQINVSGYTAFVPSRSGSYIGMEFDVFYMGYANHSVYRDTGLPLDMYGLNKIWAYSFGVETVVTVNGVNTTVPAWGAKKIYMAENDHKMITVTSNAPIIIKLGNDNPKQEYYNEYWAELKPAGITEIPKLVMSPITRTPEMVEPQYIEIQSTDNGELITPALGKVPTTANDGNWGPMTSDYNNKVTLAHDTFVHISSVKFMGYHAYNISGYTYNPYTISIKKNGVVLHSKTVNVESGIIAKVGFDVDITLLPTDVLTIESDKPVIMREVDNGSYTHTFGLYDTTAFTVSNVSTKGSIDAFPNEVDAYKAFKPFATWNWGMKRASGDFIYNLKYEAVPFSEYRITFINEAARPTGWKLYGYTLKDDRYNPWTLIDDRRYFDYEAFEGINIPIANPQPYIQYKVEFYDDNYQARTTQYVEVDQISFYTAGMTVAHRLTYESAIAVFGWTDGAASHDNGWVYVADTNSVAVKTGIIEWEDMKIDATPAILKCYVEFSADNAAWTAPITKANGEYITDAEMGVNRYVRFTFKLEHPEGGALTEEDYIWFTNVKFSYREVI